MDIIFDLFMKNLGLFSCVSLYALSVSYDTGDGESFLFNMNLSPFFPLAGMILVSSVFVDTKEYLGSYEWPGVWNERY